MVQKKLLLLIADDFPTHRPDVTVLFGKELPRHGILSDLVAQQSREPPPNDVSWPPGKACVCARTGNRTRDQVAAFWHDCRALWQIDFRAYDAIQVRDKVFAGVVGLLSARLHRRPFFYWMSFPTSEGFLDLAHREGLSLGIARWAFLEMKGRIGRWLLYRFLLPACDHIFVQSDRMACDLGSHGIPAERMTAIPMGVDLDAMGPIASCPLSFQQQLAGRRVIGYLGTLDRMRGLDILLEALVAVRKQVPNACLLLVGDAPELADREWLMNTAVELKVDDAVIWTGWLPTATAWDYLRHADVAVSVFPRGALLDSASPTKVIEYLALGLPVVANDQPDQQKVLTESGAGLSVEGNAIELAKAITRVLGDPALRASMSAAGPPYVKARRSYALLGEYLANVYQRLWAI